MFTQWKLGDKKNVTTAKLIAAVKQGAGDASYAAKLSKGKKYTTNLIWVYTVIIISVLTSTKDMQDIVLHVKCKVEFFATQYSL